MIAVLCLITLPSTKIHTLAGGAQVRWSSLKMDVVGGIKKKITSWCWIYDRLFRSSSAMWDLDPTGFKPWLWAPYRLLLPFPFKVSSSLLLVLFPRWLDLFPLKTHKLTRTVPSCCQRPVPFEHIMKYQSAESYSSKLLAVYNMFCGCL